MKPKLVRVDLYIREDQRDFLQEYINARTVSKSHLMRQALDLLIQRLRKESK